MKVFKNLYEYRELLKSSIKKDVGGKYKNSVLGVLWRKNNGFCNT